MVVAAVVVFIVIGRKKKMTRTNYVRKSNELVQKIDGALVSFHPFFFSYEVRGETIFTLRGSRFQSRNITEL